jgi:hypothetical protein
MEMGFVGLPKLQSMEKRLFEKREVAQLVKRFKLP